MASCATCPHTTPFSLYLLFFLAPPPHHSVRFAKVGDPPPTQLGSAHNRIVMVYPIDFDLPHPPSAVTAAPHPLKHCGTAQDTVLASAGEGELLAVGVSPRISTNARKRRQDAAKTNSLSCSSPNAIKASKGSSKGKMSLNSSGQGSSMTSSGRRSQQQKSSARGIHSVDSFDPAEVGNVSDIASSSAARSSLLSSYGEGLQGYADACDEDNVQLGDADMIYDYCEEDDVVEGEHHDAASRTYHQQQQQQADCVEEEDIPEELVDDDGAQCIDESIETLTDDPHAYDDYDEDDACLNMSPVRTNTAEGGEHPHEYCHPRLDDGELTLGIASDEGGIWSAPPVKQWDESSLFQTIRDKLLESHRHPFIFMYDQELDMTSAKSERHYEFCSKQHQAQQVSTHDRTAMIKALLCEAHRHHTSRVEDNDPHTHKRGWQTIAADADRTMTIEGPLSAQRKLSCMCIFNPHRTQPPSLDGADDDRMHRMHRQEALLTALYQREDGILFLDTNSVRDGVSTPHPTPMYQASGNSEASHDDNNSGDEEETSFSAEGNGDSVVSIPLPSYASSGR